MKGDCYKSSGRDRLQNGITSNKIKTIEFKGNIWFLSNCIIQDCVNDVLKKYNKANEVVIRTDILHNYEIVHEVYQSICKNFFRECKNVNLITISGVKSQ